MRVDVAGLGANASGNQEADADDLFVDVPEADEMGSFIFRTTGFNSIGTLAARLQYFAAVCGGKLSAMPLELRLRGKSTTQSHRTPVYYVDLVVRSGMSLVEAVQSAKAVYGQREAGGFDQLALDAALYVANVANVASSIQAGIELARGAINSGKAKAKLHEFVKMSVSLKN